MHPSFRAVQFLSYLNKKGTRRNTIDRVFDSIRSIINPAFKENGRDGHNVFSGTCLPDGLRSGCRKPAPKMDHHAAPEPTPKNNKEFFSIIALLSYTDMRLGEAINLLKYATRWIIRLPISTCSHPHGGH